MGNRSTACVKKYSTELGMPLGTANAILRKKLLWSLADQLRLLVCFRCELPIETCDDFTIDHREPWRGVDPKLFWDLDNIAFSHAHCNGKAARSSFKEGPPGTSWCTQCKTFPLVEDFGPGDRKNGLSKVCKECDRERMRTYDARYPRFSCPECGNRMRKTCSKCGWDLPMKDYMALRRREGAKY